jgi:hypothetical protein
MVFGLLVERVRRERLLSLRRAAQRALQARNQSAPPASRFGVPNPGRSKPEGHDYFFTFSETAPKRKKKQKRKPPMEKWKTPPEPLGVPQLSQSRFPLSHGLDGYEPRVSRSHSSNVQGRRVRRGSYFQDKIAPPRGNQIVVVSPRTVRTGRKKGRSASFAISAVRIRGPT